MTTITRTTRRLTKREQEIVKRLNFEIKYRIGHNYADETIEFNKGVINGLEQAVRLVEI